MLEGSEQRAQKYHRMYAFVRAEEMGAHGTCIGYLGLSTGLLQSHD